MLTDPAKTNTNLKKYVHTCGDVNVKVHLNKKNSLKQTHTGSPYSQPYHIA